jgi:hypothetical protein
MRPSSSRPPCSRATPRSSCWRGPTKTLDAKRIVVAWNDSPEAMAAVRRALPLLVKADLVSICMVAPERHASQTADPGAELSKMLSRHGANVEVCLLPQTLPRSARSSPAMSPTATPTFW